MDQERFAFWQSAGLALAGRVMESGMFRHIGVANLHRRTTPEVRPGVDLAVHDSAVSGV